MDHKDRIPSEIFEILSALQGDGTQAERLKMRKRAIKVLLTKLLAFIEDANGNGDEERDGKFWTIYDGLAIEAWQQGLIPPNKRRGVPLPHRSKSSQDLYIKAVYRKLYHDLGGGNSPRSRSDCLRFLSKHHRLDPKWLKRTEDGSPLSSSDRLELLSDCFKLDVEWLNNVIRSNKASLLRAVPQDRTFPDILDMWLEWEWYQRDARRNK